MESAWEIMHEVDVELARDIADRIDESESRNNISSNTTTTAVYYYGGQSSSSVFNKHIKDDNLIENILSFCDFHSAVETGKTCKRLKKISDDCLDHAAAYIARNVKNMLPMSVCGYSGGDNAEAILRKNIWTYGTRSALIEDGIELCNPEGHVSLEDETNYDEGQARYLLQTRGYVDVTDSLIDQDDIEMADEVGWNVKCRLRQINRQKAATKIMLPGDYDEYHYDEENDRIIRYYSLCLLRKADLSSIQYGFLEAEYRHTDYPSHELRFSVMFKLSSSATNDNDTNGTKFDFFFTRQCGGYD
jgi:hypothetical protein